VSVFPEPNDKNNLAGADIETRGAMVRDSRTALSFVFGLVGGLLILTITFLFLPSAFYYGGGYGYGPFYYGVFGIVLAISSGALVIVGATMSFVRPSQGVTWGIVMVVFGALSLFGLGGFGIGMALSVTGGALAIVAGASGPSPGGRPQRACTSCGMLIAPEYAHCPYCGHAMTPLPR
jgi:hypothetical protein